MCVITLAIKIKIFCKFLSINNLVNLLKIVKQKSEKYSVLVFALYLLYVIITT